MLEEVRVGPRSTFATKTLGESDIRGRYGVTVVAIKRDAADPVLHPNPGERVEAGDVIVAMGQDDALRRLQQACRSDG